MPLSIREIGIVPSVERFVSTNYLLRHIVVLGLLVVLALCVSIVTYVLAIHYGRPTQFPSSDPRVGFQSGSSGRDTMDIISSCATTLVTCIYSSVHFDVPRSYVHRLPFFSKVTTRDYWLELWTKVSFWLLGLLSPEMLVLHAFYEYMLARRDVSWMRAHGYAEWNLSHSFAADMGALALPAEGTSTAGGGDEGGMVRARSLRSGFALHEKLLRNKEPGALDCKALEYELADHVKADSLFKIITTLQIVRFFLGTLVRWIFHLPVAPLEYITCAYVGCTLLYYGLWFHKPYNVNERIVLRVTPELQRAQQIRSSDSLTIDDSGTVPATSIHRGRQSLRLFLLKAGKSFLYPPLSDAHRMHGSERMWQTSPYMTQGSLVATAASLLVGLAHLACWDVEFPNANGQPLWRACTLVLIVVPIIVFVIILGAAIIQRRWVTAAMNVMALTLIVVYCIARLVLFILLGHSFESLPAAVYSTRDVPWLSYIPFIH
ncbi:hypothetical protein FKP32DRAFT_1581665 [Trametes sanguinea]|nr:hypothetical protein FKP32DRAFT_1581665 [Trametes sanguinea]